MGPLNRNRFWRMVIPLLLYFFVVHLGTSFAQTSKSCLETEFTCSNNKCIPQWWRCDKENDCGDNSDEICSSKTCSETEFTCINNNCIPKQWQCDKENDCGDNSDENTCSSKICSETEFTCYNNNCIPKRWQCDKDNDCGDNSDENTCLSKRCSKTEFTCNNNKCVPKRWQCDQENDCGDNSDENTCSSNTCSETEFTCNNNKCIPKSWQCDKKNDCGDNSDEAKNCPSKTCSETEFTCNNNMCIPKSWQCDKKNDCGDNSDEPENCNIDKCEILGFCSQICNNTEGGFECSCTEGYQIDANRSHFCKAIGHEASLLFAQLRDIFEIQLSSFHKHSIVRDQQNVISFDYLYKDGIIMWSDIKRQKILSASIYNSSSIKIIIENVSHSDGIAIDWIYNHIYWTNTGNNTIEVADLKGKFRKTLISTDLDEPRAIVVDPRSGWMYWSDWGVQPKIEKAGQDGTHRKAIILKDIKWPNGLTIDYILNRLYWVDGKLDMIAHCDFEGLDRQIILSSSRYSGHPFSIAVFEDTLFWTDWTSKSIYSTNKFHGGNISVIISNLFYIPMDILVYHELKYPAGINHCGPQNGLCSHLCLPTPQINENSTKYSCACNDGWELLDNGISCYNEELEYFE